MCKYIDLTYIYIQLYSIVAIGRLLLVHLNRHNPFEMPLHSPHVCPQIFMSLSCGDDNCGKRMPEYTHISWSLNINYVFA